MENTNYETEFPKRTQELFKNNFERFKNENLEFTFLLNCLLGLIIIKTETNKIKGNIDEDFLNFIPKKIGFIRDLDKDLIERANINITVKKHSDLLSESKDWFMGRIRNAIAHQHIEPINNNEIWKEVKMFNKNGKIKDFEIVFSLEELKQFALHISEQS